MKNKHFEMRQIEKISNEPADEFEGAEKTDQVDKPDEEIDVDDLLKSVENIDLKSFKDF